MADTTAETPGFCDNCFSGNLRSGTPTGTEIKLGGLDTYIAVPENKEPTGAVLVITDVFGWKLVNSRLISDELAKGGLLAILPDFFNGDGNSPSVSVLYRNHLILLLFETDSSYPSSALPADALLFPPGIFKKISHGFSLTVGAIKLLTVRPIPYGRIY